MEENFNIGDWAAYNWLDDAGNDNWKVGRILMTGHGLMYYCRNDGTDRYGWMPLSSGVIKLENK